MEERKGKGNGKETEGLESIKDRRFALENPAQSQNVSINTKKASRNLAKSSSRSTVKNARVSLQSARIQNALFTHAGPEEESEEEGESGQRLGRGKSTRAPHGGVGGGERGPLHRIISHAIQCKNCAFYSVWFFVWELLLPQSEQRLPSTR